MRLFKPTAAVLSVLAAGSIAATDVAAADLPVSVARASVATHGVFDAEAMKADDHRYYPYGYRRYRRSTAADILTGVVILGTVAAIANAASKNNRDRDERYRDRDYRYRDNDYRDRDARYRDRRGDSRYDESRGIDRAVEMCVREVERDARVDRVDSVERDGEGWEVEGRLYNGEQFSCEIGSDGRIEDIEIDGRDVAYAAPRGSGAEVDDRQWDEQRYAQARARLDRATPVPERSAQAPAYPGGPVDGDVIDEDLAASGSTGGDGRYDAHTAPDFDDA